MEGALLAFNRSKDVGLQLQKFNVIAIRHRDAKTPLRAARAPMTSSLSETSGADFLRRKSFQECLLSGDRAIAFAVHEIGNIGYSIPVLIGHIKRMFLCSHGSFQLLDHSYLFESMNRWITCTNTHATHVLTYFLSQFNLAP